PGASGRPHDAASRDSPSPITSVAPRARTSEPIANISDSSVRGLRVRIIPPTPANRGRRLVRILTRGGEGSAAPRRAGADLGDRRRHRGCYEQRDVTPLLLATLAWAIPPPAPQRPSPAPCVCICQSAAPPVAPPSPPPDAPAPPVATYRPTVDTGSPPDRWYGGPA